MILNGLFGGAAVVAEGTYGTDPATGYAWVHCIPGTSPTPRKERMERESLGFVPESSPPFKTIFVEGELKMHLNMSDAIVGVILRACGIRTGSSAPFLYTIDGTTSGHPPTTNSLSLLLDYGLSVVTPTHLQYVVTGAKPTKLVFEFVSNKRPTLTVSYIGRGFANKGTPFTLATPADSLISVPSDFPQVQLAAGSFSFKTLTITVDLPKSGAEQNRFGGTSLSEPISNGPISVTAALGMDFGNDADHNSLAELQDWLGSGTFGTLTVGTVAQVRFQMTSAWMLGDWPVITGGLTPATLNIASQQLLINCVA